MDKILKIQNLSGGYNNNIILKNVNLDLEQGSMTAIIGPNGSGKSTLLRYLIKELKCKDNSIIILNKDINAYSQLTLSKEISFVTQNSKQEYEFTIEELVSLGRYNHNDIENCKNVVSKVLKQVGLNKIKNKKITEISGGELQLAMLARAICQEAKIIILDEPTNNLDPKHQHLIMSILTRLKEQNITIICVMHDINLVLQYFDNVVMLKNGKVVKKGKTEKIINEKAIEQVFDIRVKINPSRDQLPSTVCYIP